MGEGEIGAIVEEKKKKEERKEKEGVGMITEGKGRKREIENVKIKKR